MTSIELEDKTAQALRDQATARNLPLDSYLRQLADTATPLNAAIPLEDFDRMVDSVAGNYPVIPGSFNRDDIYSDHN